jgi:hypothetical protein
VFEVGLVLMILIMQRIMVQMAIPQQEQIKHLLLQMMKHKTYNAI